MENFLINLPIDVTRGSFFALLLEPSSLADCQTDSCRSCALTTMLRNFRILKGFPLSPTRFWMKSIGPKFVIKMPIAVAMSMGDSTMIAKSEKKISNNRLAIF